ncbi:MAG: hypothetical protein KDC57_03900 [Saprospiraceae bacterium]|nr:hypothetical protein [Saprospiraceae bacterium]
MNLLDQNFPDKPVALTNLLRDAATVSLIRLQAHAQLSAHQSKTNALLILLNGEVVYQEDDREMVLHEPYDYVRITARKTHELSGRSESLLLLVQ